MNNLSNLAWQTPAAINNVNRMRYDAIKTYHSLINFFQWYFGRWHFLTRETLICPFGCWLFFWLANTWLVYFIYKNNNNLIKHTFLFQIFCFNEFYELGFNFIIETNKKYRLSGNYVGTILSLNILSQLDSVQNLNFNSFFYKTSLRKKQKKL